MKRALSFVFAILTIAPAARPFAQSPISFDPENAISEFRSQARQIQKTRTAQKGNRIRVETKLVYVDVTVKNMSGHVITQLKKDDFRIFEDDGYPQEVAHFDVNTLPLAVALVVDCSASLQLTLNKLRNASKVALKALKSADQVALITFKDAAAIDVPLGRGNADQISDVISRLVSDGNTNINDAIYIAIDHLYKKAPESRRVVIVVSDNGADRLTTVGHKDLVELALKDDVAVYNIKVPGGAVTIQTPQGQGELSGPLLEDFLKSNAKNNLLVHVPALTQDSGGEVFDIENLSRDELKDALESVIATLGTRYTLSFYPTDHPSTKEAKQESILRSWNDDETQTESKRSGIYHTLRVDLDAKWGIRGQNYKIIHKKGYYAP